MSYEWSQYISFGDATDLPDADLHPIGGLFLALDTNDLYKVVAAEVGHDWEVAGNLGGSGGGDAADVTYTPAVLADWSGSADPGDVDNALDQLAERTTDLEPNSHAVVTLAADADAILSLSTQEIGLDTQDANTVLAGPTTGEAADPDFRALVAADLPAISLDDLSDVNAAAPNNGDVVTWSASASEWTAAAPPAGGAVDAADVTYTPAVATDWDSDADPGNADDALDQLAERVDDLEGAGGHDPVTLDADVSPILDLTGQEIGLDVQNANTVLAGPSTGVANEPTFRSLVAADLPADDGWKIASGIWTPRSQAFTNDPAAGANIELEMADTSGFAVGDIVNVSSSAGSENALVTVVHANTHLTVAALYYNHTTTNPLVRLASTLYVDEAYTNDPAAGNDIELNMADTTGFAVGDLVEVSSSAGRENATVTVVHVNTHITVNTLALNHTTTSPMVKQVVQNTFIVDTSGDLSSSIGAGHRIKLTDSTVKYFIVVAIATTRLTLYGGTDYSIVSTAALSSPYYSMVKAPFGFPLNPLKWTVEVSDNAQRAQATPGQNTWYNPGSITISFPIGIWRVYYRTCIRANDASASTWNVESTLSTANNSESDNDFTNRITTGSLATTSAMMTAEKYLSITTKTPYYLNIRTTIASLDAIDIRGDLNKTIIRLICTYL